MKYLSNKKGFLGVDNKTNFKENVVIVPFGLEKTVSYGGGTNRGPIEIIKASHQVELFDEELSKEPYKNIGIKTLSFFPIKKKITDALDQIANINKLLLDKKKFPSVKLIDKCINSGSSSPIIINASNEVLVDLFLKGKIRYLDIVSTINMIFKDKEFNKYARRKAKSIKDIKIIDNWARLKTINMCVR